MGTGGRGASRRATCAEGLIGRGRGALTNRTLATATLVDRIGAFSNTQALRQVVENQKLAKATVFTQKLPAVALPGAVNSDGHVSFVGDVDAPLAKDFASANQLAYHTHKPQQRSHKIRSDRGPELIGTLEQWKRPDFKKVPRTITEREAGFGAEMNDASTRGNRNARLATLGSVALNAEAPTTEAVDHHLKWAGAIDNLLHGHERVGRLHDEIAMVRNTKPPRLDEMDWRYSRLAARSVGLPRPHNAPLGDVMSSADALQMHRMAGSAGAGATNKSCMHRVSVPMGDPNRPFPTVSEMRPLAVPRRNLLEPSWKNIGAGSKALLKFW